MYRYYLSVMPKRHSKKIRLLEHHSSSSSSSESDSENTLPAMPTTRPTFGPIESCDLISQLRMFIPLLASAELPTESCDPELIDPVIQVTEELETEHGVEMDISLGVYDVTGSVTDAQLANMNIPVVSAPEPEPLIQEL